MGALWLPIALGGPAEYNGDAGRSCEAPKTGGR